MFARSWTPRGPLLVLLEVVYSITDPPIRALRRIIPPLRLGSIALDLSFLIVMIGAYVLLSLTIGSSCPDRPRESYVTPDKGQRYCFDRTVLFTAINEWVRSCR